MLCLFSGSTSRLRALRRVYWTCARHCGVWCGVTTRPCSGTSRTIRTRANNQVGVVFLHEIFFFIPVSSDNCFLQLSGDLHECCGPLQLHKVTVQLLSLSLKGVLLSPKRSPINFSVVSSSAPQGHRITSLSAVFPSATQGHSTTSLSMVSLSASQGHHSVESFSASQGHYTTYLSR